MRWPGPGGSARIGRLAAPTRGCTGRRSPVTHSPGPTETGVLGPPPAGAMSAYPRPSAVRPHILVVNGRKVRHPVFVLGAPCSAVAILGRALKRSEGFHLTMAQRWVLPVVHAFARNPHLARGKAEAAATVLRDAFAQGWQVSPHCCLGCTVQCREA